MQNRLDNHRVRVTEVIMEPGAPRPAYVRETDQIVIFLDDCTYERRDAETGARLERRRERGEILWHNRGERAPQLTNTGTAPYRALVIELK
jgi:hypothetical protein